MTIAYQGIPGSYSHISANNYFKGSNNFIGTNQFKEIFNLVKNGKADYGVIPVENSLAGSVYENYDLLDQYHLQVVGEYYLKIEHYLMGINTNLNEIKNIYSHPKAIEQCLKLFDQYPDINKNIYSDTAGAAKYVAEQKDPTLGTIASSEAGKLYDLQVIKKNIEDNPHNYTRFLIITKDKTDIKEADKCSLIFKLLHIPGSLHKTLKIFADQNLNLTKIESRPIHGLPFEYNFYIDLDFIGLKTKKMKEILKDLKSKVLELKVLGLYKSAYENIS